MSDVMGIETNIRTTGFMFMEKRVFISYSHKDEQHRETLEEHLSNLQRKGAISVWHDRKIAAGTEWEESIDQELECADLILFLVSPSFLASPYCQDKEVKRALERQANGEAIVISIIVRPCDWMGCEFAKLQAVPEDGVPITEWENQDRGWLDAIKQITDQLDRVRGPQPVELTSTTGAQLKQAVLSWMEDTEILLAHRNLPAVKLTDIYVVPDVQTESDPNRPDSDLIRIVSATEPFSRPGHYLFAGEEQQGKTCLLKYFYMELRKQGRLPLFLEASKIRTSKISDVISSAVIDQYEGIDAESYLAYEEKVLLVDNFDDIGLNRKFRAKFIKEINAVFDFVVLTSHTSFTYVSGDLPELDGYDQYSILGLGNKKREEIIQRWVSLGVEESIGEMELYSQCDEQKMQLDTIIKKNIVPPKPIYILMLLQMFEANSQLSLELTSYGHCYQQLIYQAFDNAKIRKADFDKYLNVLTELAWWIFVNRAEPNEGQLIEFFNDYAGTYLAVDRRSVISKLTAHSILAEKGDKVGFKYPYIYYFFVGKKIAESYADSNETRDAVSGLIDQLHREDFANVLIFITHHTKDSWVLGEITKVLSGLFDDQEPATLARSELEFMEAVLKKIPELVIEQREIQKERDKHNERLDEIERITEELPESTEPTDTLANINKTFKAMEIAGQIIRNRHATLRRTALYELAERSSTSGLRFLQYFINVSDKAKREIIKVIENQLAEHPSLSDKEIEKQAEHAYLHLTYGVINGVVRKIGSSIGSKEALEIYKALEDAEKTPAFCLIRQAIELQFTKDVNIDSVRKTVEVLKDNPVALRILKEMIIQHIYMFPVGYKEKQQLSSVLGISVRGQRFMEIRKTGKG